MASAKKIRKQEKVEKRKEAPTGPKPSRERDRAFGKMVRDIMARKRLERGDNGEG